MPGIFRPYPFRPLYRRRPWILPGAERTAILNVTLDGLGLSTDASALVGGALAQTLDALTSSSAGTVLVLGSSSITLDGIGLVGAGGVLVLADASNTLADFTATIAGVLPIAGAATITLDAATLNADGSVSLSGILTATLDNLTATLESGVLVQAVVNPFYFLDSFTSSATGNPEAQAGLSATLSDLSLSASGSFPQTADLAATLEGLGLAGAVGVLNLGDLSGILSDLSATVDGSVPVVASFTATLGNLSLASDSAGTLFANLSISLDGIGLSASTTGQPIRNEYDVESVIWTEWDTLVANPTIHKNDVGTRFTDTLYDENRQILDVSDATLMRITFRKPNGTTVQKTAVHKTDGTDGKISYVTVTNDLDTVGRWSLQSYVETPLGKWYGTVKAFQVQGNI